MDCLTRAYLLGTNPSSTISSLVCADVMISILIYSTIYTVVVALIGHFILFPKMKKTFPIHFFLMFIVIMMIGYPCRLWRAKSLFRYTKNLSRTQSVMDAGFSCWYFLG
jgi:hypothetical protein